MREETSGDWGDIDVRLGRNVFRRSCQADLLVGFARYTTSLGLNDDPYIRNRLVVDGRVVAHGTRQFFDAESCPALEFSGHVVVLESLGRSVSHFSP